MDQVLNVAKLGKYLDIENQKLVKIWLLLFSVQSYHYGSKDVYSDVTSHSSCSQLCFFMSHKHNFSNGKEE